MKHVRREEVANGGYVEFDFHDDEWAKGFGVFIEAGYLAGDGQAESTEVIEIPRKQARKFAKALLKATKKRGKNG